MTPMAVADPPSFPQVEGGMAVLNARRLRLALARRGMTQGRLAKLAGLREETLSRAIGGRPIRVSTLSAIAAALDAVPVQNGVDDLIGEVQP